MDSAIYSASTQFDSDAKKNSAQSSDQQQQQKKNDKTTNPQPKIRETHKNKGEQRNSITKSRILRH